MKNPLSNVFSTNLPKYQHINLAIYQCNNMPSYQSTNYQRAMLQVYEYVHSFVFKLFDLMIYYILFIIQFSYLISYFNYILFLTKNKALIL